MQRLVSDIGGTNARFALVGDDGWPKNENTLKTKDFPGVVEAADTYLDGRSVDGVVLVVAGPVEEDRIALTNCPWAFSLDGTKTAMGVKRLIAINDFVAQALSIPRLDASDCEKLGGGEALDDRAIAVIGPGTGLGVAGLLKTDGIYRPIPTEGGHVAFAPRDETEDAVLGLLRARFGHVSNERLLSGPGLVNLALALANIRDAELSAESPADIVSKADEEACPICIEAIERFCDLLGAAAGDLALTYGARGGVYLTGGMVSHLGRHFDTARVMSAFVDKGRFRAYLDAIPVMRVRRTNTGLIGAAAAAMQLG
ncbi:MAG: glucokinase [Pseudomonadota bacterium]